MMRCIRLIQTLAMWGRLSFLLPILAPIKTQQAIPQSSSSESKAHTPSLGTRKATNSRHPPRRLAAVLTTKSPHQESSADQVVQVVPTIPLLGTQSTAGRMMTCNDMSLVPCGGFWTRHPYVQTTQPCPAPLQVQSMKTHPRAPKDHLPNLRLHRLPYLRQLAELPCSDRTHLKPHQCCSYTASSL